MRNVTIENAINQKLKKKNVSRFLMITHCIYDEPITTTQSTTLIKSRERGFFFPTVEKYLTVTNISKTVSLEGE